MPILARRISAGGGDASLIVGKRARLRKVIVGNVTATSFLKIYDTASAPTAGAGTPVLSLHTGGAGGRSPVIFDFEPGIVFFSGIGITMVTGNDDTDATAVLSTQLVVHLLYDH